jgi:hypothetical protein
MSQVGTIETGPKELPRFLTAAMIRRFFLPISDRTFERWVVTKKFPAADFAPSQRMKLWLRETVEAWANAKKPESM